VKAIPLILFLLLLSVPVTFLAAEEGALNPGQDKHAVSLDLYFYNYSYFFFTLDMGYRSPALVENLDLRATAAFKSYGMSVFMLKPGIQEFQATAELYKPLWQSGSLDLTGYALAGGILWFSTRTGEANCQLLAGGGLLLTWQRLEVRLPGWLRFYGDGFAFYLVPQIGLRLGPFTIRATFETTTLATYDFTNGDFRGRIGLGTEFRF
jgi:hypothetical protein